MTSSQAFREAKKIAKQIMAWDREDISVLMASMMELYRHCEANRLRPGSVLSIAEIPSQPFPPSLDPRGVVAVDANRLCLVLKDNEMRIRKCEDQVVAEVKTLSKDITETLINRRATKTVTIRVEPEMEKAIWEAAYEEGLRSVSEWVRRAIIERLPKKRGR